jgi:predicted amino acid dehydrogenase
VVEATGNAAAVAEVLAPHVGRVVIANPKQVRRKRRGETEASSGLHGVHSLTAAACRSAFQVQGSSRSSSWALVRPETTRSSTSVSHAKGSTPFSFAVATRLATIAQ